MTALTYQPFAVSGYSNAEAIHFAAYNIMSTAPTALFRFFDLDTGKSTCVYLAYFTDEEGRHATTSRWKDIRPKDRESYLRAFESAQTAGWFDGIKYIITGDGEIELVK